MSEHEHTNRTLIILMIIIVIIIAIIYFWPTGFYIVRPATITVQRSVPSHPMTVQSHVYVTSPSTSSSYQQETYTTTTTTSTTTQ